MEHTITGNNYKFVFFRDVMNSNFWISGDDLVFRNQRFSFLELEVPQSARQSKVAYAFDEQTGRSSSYSRCEPLTRPLATWPPAAMILSFSAARIMLKSIRGDDRMRQTLVRRFVIKTKRFHFAFDAENRSRVACICLMDALAFYTHRRLHMCARRRVRARRVVFQKAPMCDACGPRQ